MQPDFLLAVVMVGSLTLYALLGGADYGGGIWDLLSSGVRAQAQRVLIAKAITPVWEVNHVWLILVIVLLFAGFPAAFAAISTALFVPIMALLIGIIFRGVSFTFRSYDTRSPGIQRSWGLGFSIASVITPFLLGVIVGGITNGRVMMANGNSVSGFVHPWFSPFPFVVGCFAVALFAYLAASYLTVEADTAELREDFRARALFSGCVVAILALLTFFAAWWEAPQIKDALLHRRWAWIEPSLTALASIFAFRALWRRNFLFARLAVAAQATGILWGWAVAQYPFLVRPLLTIQNSSAPAAVQRDLLIACTAGTVVLLPSMRYLYVVFKAAPIEVQDNQAH